MFETCAGCAFLYKNEENCPSYLLDVESLLPQHPIYGTEDPRDLTASLNTGYNNFNLAYHRCNQPPNAGNYYCCVGATDYEDPYYGKVSRKFERKKEGITARPESFIEVLDRVGGNILVPKACSSLPVRLASVTLQAT